MYLPTKPVFPAAQLHSTCEDVRLLECSWMSGTGRCLLQKAMSNTTLTGTEELISCIGRDVFKRHESEHIPKSAMVLGKHGREPIVKEQVNSKNHDRRFQQMHSGKKKVYVPDIEEACAPI